VTLQRKVTLERSNVTLECSKVTLERSKVSLGRTVTLENPEVTLEHTKVTLEGSKVTLERSSVARETIKCLEHFKANSKIVARPTLEQILQPQALRILNKNLPAAVSSSCFAAPAMRIEHPAASRKRFNLAMGNLIANWSPTFSEASKHSRREPGTPLDADTFRRCKNVVCTVNLLGDPEQIRAMRKTR
jgi:hypothetical protein